jgi:hypothetical protein
MGPFNELRQLKRKAMVLSLLQRKNLSAWARNYWQTVYDQLAMSEDQYNARVFSVYQNIKSRDFKL